MKYQLLRYQNKSKKNRPYFLIDDNNKNEIKIDKANSYTYYESIANQIQNRNMTKALVLENYFDTKYLSKIKKETIKFPTNENLGG